MVKREAKPSISEDDGESLSTNANGKRPAEEASKAGKKRLKTKSLYRQPTVNELNRLQETENLFNSNLFRLQVEEVLQEVKVKEKIEKKIQQWFSELKTHLLSITEDDTEYDLNEPCLSKKLKVKLPISKELNKSKCMFKFHKFRNVEIVGSYDLGCAINSKLRVDVQITVPAETYTKNDSVNYRYHKKRAAYLAFIASHLNKYPSIESLTYTYVNGSEAKPVLDIKPVEKLAKHFTVRLHLTCEAETYKSHRLYPSRNNLREAWLLSEETTDSNNAVGPPTPYYNSSILSDLTTSENQQFLRDVLLKSDNLKQAIVLLKIWLRQRNLHVSGHVISMFVAYLVQTKRVNNVMSSYQIVRNAWISLKSSEWDTKGLSLHKESDTPNIEEFVQHFPVVFLDKTGSYNIAWNMCKGTYSALKRESALAIEMLDNASANSFTPLFMVPFEPLQQFDHIVKFKNWPKIKESVINKAAKESKLNYGIDQLALVTDDLHSLLTKALGDRAELILQMVDADFSWPVKKTPEQAKDGFEEKLSFGIIQHPENSTNIVEKGPPANLPEAEAFRSFWGDKSELRRFQDGSITETCVWEGDTLAEQRTVTKQIVDYIVQLKFDIPSTDLFHVIDQFDSLLTYKRYSAHTEESSIQVVRAFDELRTDMRALRDLPLDISSVYGVSPVFSYSAPLPPLPAAPARTPWRRANCGLVKEIAREDASASVPEYVQAARAVIELGHSGKWPGDLNAFRCLKSAFNLQIATQIQKQYSIPTQAYPTHIDVVKNGLVFRLEIAHPKEITLLRREKENGVVKYRETEESINLQRDTVLLPRLRSALHGIHQKHPAFGPSSCLVDRWVRSQLLLPAQLPPLLPALLAARAFLAPRPHPAPANPLQGFVRALALLADTDWTREMVLLDFNGDMTKEDILKIEEDFKSRDISTHPLYIATSYDGPLPSVWTQGSPDARTLARVQTLASATRNYLNRALLHDLRDNILAAFVPSYSGYDLLIHLHPHLVPHNNERVTSLPRSQDPPRADLEYIPPVEFDPVQRYIHELQSAYGEFAVFFHDCYGGDVIAVLWKPDIKDAKEFQVSTANALRPLTSKGEITYKVNVEAIIEDFRILGHGLVKDVTVN